VREFGAICDGKADNSETIQATINAAQERVDRLGDAAPAVIFPPGTCRITRPLVWKSCPLIGVDPGVSTRVVWDGPDDGGPALNKPRGFFGGGRSNRIKGISFEAANENRQLAAWSGKTRTKRRTMSSRKSGAISTAAQSICGKSGG
jgi:hypothetical protein